MPVAGQGRRRDGERGPYVKDRRNPLVASEGLLFLLATAIAMVVVWRLGENLLLVPLGLLFMWLFLIFRDPPRAIPPSPLGVVSPVDGRVMSVEVADRGVLHGEAYRVRVRINSLGTYTARAPVEGKIMSLRSLPDATADYRTNALWIQTDEGDDVVLQFDGYRMALAPRSFVQLGERVGQGQRSAYLRLTRVAELHLPIASTILVEKGQRVSAGCDLIAKLPSG